MLNKFYKIIHNKYYKFFNFIFFLRYLFAIFFITFALFLFIPNFLNFEKKIKFVENHLMQKYGFEFYNYENIKFNSLPIPNLEFKNATIAFTSSDEKMNVEKLKIYPYFFYIYNFENFQSKKIIFVNNNISLESRNLDILIKKLFYQKSKIFFKNLNVNIKEKDKIILKIKNIKFKNFGHRKNFLIGEIFKKKFVVNLGKNLRKINFEIENSGIDIDINFIENNRKDLIEGTLKSKILNTNFKSNFLLDKKEIKIVNFYLRNKYTVFSNESLIILKPFLDINSKFYIEEFKPEIFKNIDLGKLIESKEIIKKINSKNKIYFESKKFSNNLFDQLYLRIDSAYGMINYSKSSLIAGNPFECEGNINLLEDFPLFLFDCKIFSNNKKNFFKKFSIKTKNQENFNLSVKGSINILNKKINFKKILVNEDYEASNEDLKYFKVIFENIFFDKGFTNILNVKKIKEFISEIN